MRKPPIHVAVAALAAFQTFAAFASDPDPLIDAGRRIYREGVLPSGAPLHAVREGSASIDGSAAACILCHRRSGMGASEGLNTVPPVIGAALFGTFRRPGDRPLRHAPGIEFRDFPHRTRPPYDDATLARAIRDGTSTSGHRFQYLMPRYELADADMAALIAYLRTLSADASSGAQGPILQLATIVVPGVNEARRATFVDVLNACVAERQIRQRDGLAGGWRMNLWQLEGPPDSWETQLRERYARAPVFAIVSGLGDTEWAPVQRFCEAEGVPCVFANVDLPGEADDATYTFYFSRGVVLEAQVFSSYLMEHRARLGIKRVLQLSADRAGATAAATLERALAPQGFEVVNRQLSLPAQTEAAARWLSEASATDALVLWLRADAIAALMRRLPAPPKSRPILFSGLLGGLERTPVASAWRRVAYLAYPVEAPGRWEQRLRYNLRPWLDKHGLASRDERLQGNTLAACTTFAEGVYRMQGILQREYLLETIEYSLSAMGNAGATAAYPRFVLGTNQRFASKGSYIVRFAEPAGTKLIREGDWITP